MTTTTTNVLDQIRSGLGLPADRPDRNRVHEAELFEMLAKFVASKTKRPTERQAETFASFYTKTVCRPNGMDPLDAWGARWRAEDILKTAQVAAREQMAEDIADYIERLAAWSDANPMRLDHVTIWGNGIGVPHAVHPYEAKGPGRGLALSDCPSFHWSTTDYSLARKISSVIADAVREHIGVSVMSRSMG